MSWGDIPNLDGLADEFASPPVPPVKRIKHYRPEVEKMRGQAERDFQNPDDQEQYLSDLQSEYDSQDAKVAARKASMVTSTLGQASPERSSYQGASLLGQIRTGRAEQGRTAAPTAETLNAGANAALYTTGGLPGLAAQAGIEAGIKHFTHQQPSFRTRDESGNVRPLGATDLAMTAASVAAPMVAGKATSMALRTRPGQAAVRTLGRAAGAVKEGLVAGERGSVITPGDTVDVYRGVSTLSNASEKPFYTTNPDLAKSYAEGAVKNFGGEPQVVKETIPKSQLKPEDLLTHNGKLSRTFSLIKGAAADETGAARVPGRGEPPLTDLEKQLQQSRDLLAAGKNDALSTFHGNAAQTAEAQQAAAKQGATFYREGGRLKRTATAMSSAVDKLKQTLTDMNTNETGAVQNPFGRDTSNVPDLTAEIDKQKQVVQNLMDDPNASPEDVTTALRHYKNLQQEHAGISNVPSQTTPPGQPELTGAGQPPLGAGTPTTGAQPPALNAEQRAEFLKVSKKQPGLIDALEAPGAKPPQLSSAQRVALAKIGREDLIPKSSPMTEAERANMLKNRAQQKVGWEQPIQETAPQTPQQAPLAATGELPPGPVRPTPQETAAYNERVRVAAASGDPQALTDAMNSDPALRQGGGAPPNPPPPPGGREGQPELGANKPGSTGNAVREVIKSALNIPGEMIALKSSLTPPFLRQGRIYAVLHPMKATKELFQTIAAAVSEGDSAKIHNTYMTDPWVIKSGEFGSAHKGYTYQDVGQVMLDLNDRVEDRQTAANSWLSKKIRGSVTHDVNGKPIELNPVKISDRQAVMELNLARTTLYGDMAEQMWQSGERDIPRYQKLANDVAHFTQRGPRGGVPNLFFSVSAQTGRAMTLWDIATQVPYGIASGRVLKPGPEQFATKGLVALVTANMIELGVLAAAGAGTVEAVGGLPILRHGKTHVDPWAGWNTQAKLVYGVSKDIYDTYGDVQSGELDWSTVPDDMAKRTSERLMQFGEKGLSPFWSSMVAETKGTDFTGHPYSLFERTKSGQLIVDWTAPFLIEGIAQSYMDEGLKGAALASPGHFLSESINSYQTLTELRNDTAKQLGINSSYQDAGPQDKAAIDAEQAVVDFKAKNPSEYQTSLASKEDSNRYVQAAKAAEDRFQTGTLDKPIREYWNDETVARGTIANDLKDQFAKQFANFDKTAFQKDLESYYAVDKTDPNGNHDFEATQAARDSFAASLSPEHQQWINEALTVSLGKKSPLHQEYLSYIDQKDKAGYFREGITGAERAAFDVQNPNLDVQQWKFGGGVQDKAGPALQTVKAVSDALALDLPNRPIKFTNTDRPINQNAKTQAAWKEYGKLIEFYQNSGSAKLRDATARGEFDGRNYSQLNSKEQERVRNAIKSDMRTDPEVNAALVWWGATEVPSQDAYQDLRNIIRKYGPLLPEKK